MKFQSFTQSVAMILLTAMTSYAGNGFFNEVLRNHGYGYSDGYHANRYCLTEPQACPSCSPIPEPVMQQQIMPEPIMQQPVIQQPMMQQAIMQQPVMQQPVIQQPVMQQATMSQPFLQPPTMAPTSSQWAASRSQPNNASAGYPATPRYQAWQPGYAPRLLPPVTAPVAFPNRAPARHW